MTARSGPAGRGFVVAGVVGLGVMGGGLAAAAFSSSDQAPATSEPGDDVHTGGPRAVAGPEGTVGWILEADWEQALESGPPMRSYGTASVSLQSLAVHDSEGDLVGYYTMGPLGFVPLAVANDDGAMDDLLAEAFEPLTQSEAEALHDQLRSTGD